MGLSSILSQLARMSLAGLRLHPPLLLFDVSFDFPFWFDTSPDPPTWRRKVGKKMYKSSRNSFQSGSLCLFIIISVESLSASLLPTLLKRKTFNTLRSIGRLFIVSFLDSCRNHIAAADGSRLFFIFTDGGLQLQHVISFDFEREKKCLQCCPLCRRRRLRSCGDKWSAATTSGVAITADRSRWMGKSTTNDKSKKWLFFQKNIFSLFFRTWRAKYNSSPRTLQRLIGVGRLIGHLSAVGMLLPVLLLGCDWCCSGEYCYKYCCWRCWS